MGRGRRRLFLRGLVLCTVSLLFGDLAYATETVPLFRATHLANGDPVPLKLEIRADFSQIFGKRYGYGTDKRNRTRVPAEIRLVGTEANHFPAVQMAELSGRGAMRGNECPFPPLKIEFRGRPKAPSYFRDVDEIKVVTHCGENVLGRKDSIQDQLLKEFTVYRLHAIVAAPKSFQTRLVQARYIDTSGQHEDVIDYAIFVEDLSDFIRRLGVRRLFSPKDSRLKAFDESFLATHVGQFAPRKWVEMMFFQKLVWNYDFELGHNLKGIVTDEGWLPIPYDFDYAELFYRKSEEVPAEEMMLYPYHCLSRSQVEKMVADYQAIAAEMVKLIEVTKLVSESSKDIAIGNIADAVRYLELMPRPENSEELSPCPER